MKYIVPMLVIIVLLSLLVLPSIFVFLLGILVGLIMPFTVKAFISGRKK